LYRAWLNRGQALAALGDVDAALEAYREAGRRNPAIEAPLVLSATLAERTGRPEVAIAAYRSLLAGKGLTGPELGKFLYERAFRLHAEGADAMAEVLLSRAGEEAPEIADIPLLRGETLEQLGRHDAAVKSYRLALALRPGWGAGMARLARLLAAHPDPSQRVPDEALALTRMMIEAGAAEVPEVLDIHAMALAAAGRTAEAERIAAQAAALVHDDPPARAAYEARRALYRDGLPYTITAPVTP
jgi:tetratricopeptide (TPR) repeat protein